MGINLTSNFLNKEISSKIRSNSSVSDEDIACLNVLFRLAHRPLLSKTSRQGTKRQQNQRQTLGAVWTSSPRSDEQKLRNWRSVFLVAHLYFCSSSQSVCDRHGRHALSLPTDVGCSVVGTAYHEDCIQVNSCSVE